MSIKKLASILLAFVMIITGTISPSFAGEGKDINSASFSDLVTSDAGNLEFSRKYSMHACIADIPVGTSPDTVIGYAVVTIGETGVWSGYDQTVKIVELKGNMIEGFSSASQGKESCIVNIGGLSENTTYNVVDPHNSNLHLLGKNITATTSTAIAFQNSRVGADTYITYTDAAGILRFAEYVTDKNYFGVDVSTLGYKNGTLKHRGYTLPVEVGVQRYSYVVGEAPEPARISKILSDGSNFKEEVAKMNGRFAYRLDEENGEPVYCAGDVIEVKEAWFYDNNGKFMIDYNNFNPQVIKLNYTIKVLDKQLPVYAYVQVVNTGSKDESEPAVKPDSKPARKPVIVDKVNTDKVDKNNNIVVNAAKSDKVEVKADALKDISSKKDSGLTIILEDNAKVTYDDKALEAITKAAGAEAESIEVELVKAGKNAGNEKQQKAIKDSNAMEVYSISLKVKTADGVKDIHKFDGGKVTISVPFSNPDKKNLEVYRVEENGKLTHMNSSYEKGILTWVTDGHSFYMVKDADAVKAPAEAEPAETGSGFPFVWAGLGAVILGAGAFIFMKAKKSR